MILNWSGKAKQRLRFDDLSFRFHFIRQWWIKKTLAGLFAVHVPIEKPKQQDSG
jgi:hypothetical protein